ncbi:hypothetical protein F2Q70_00017296 [Brassica cretica]|uniref:Uncharacterized protein n=1 Tax=Brassica cretica TaxID=69181 RepID=A0A8S9I1T9_BRACR|nr:hypothetical protein F2Q70_00017296 [Brassica cretica]
MMEIEKQQSCRLLWFKVRFCCELVSVCAVSSEPVSVCALVFKSSFSFSDNKMEKGVGLRLKEEDEVELHRRVRCLAMDGALPTWSVCLARGSCRGDEGLSIDETALVSVTVMPEYGLSIFMTD